MNYTVRTYGVALVIAMSCGCSDPPSPSPDPDAGQDAGRNDYPRLPADCDDMSSVTSTGIGPSTMFAHLNYRIRATNRTVYYHRDGGLHTIEVPAGTGTLLLPYPQISDSLGAPRQLPRFRDFWVNGTSILGAI